MSKKLEWKIHSKTLIFLKLLDSTRRIIEKALSSDIKYCLMWSGGKDSTAMTHLVRSIRNDITIISQFDDCDWPEKQPYMNRVAEAQNWDFHKVEPGFSVWEALSKYKIGADNICAQSHHMTKNAFLQPLDTATKSFGCSGIFLGLRADESPGRKKNFELRDDTYKLKNGMWHCCPVSRWSTKDIFSYLISNDVEINPCYFQNAICSPEEIRLSWALPTVGWKGRDIEHIRRYYPKQFQRLRDAGAA